MMTNGSESRFTSHDESSTSLAVWHTARTDTRLPNWSMGAATNETFGFSVVTFGFQRVASEDASVTLKPSCLWTACSSFLLSTDPPRSIYTNTHTTLRVRNHGALPWRISRFPRMRGNNKKREKWETPSRCACADRWRHRDRPLFSSLQTRLCRLFGSLAIHRFDRFLLWTSTSAIGDDDVSQKWK